MSNLALPDAATRAAIVRLTFNHQPSAPGRDGGLSYVNGGDSSAGVTAIATLAGLRPAFAEQNRHTLSRPPRAATVGSLKPLRLTLGSDLIYNVREGSARFSFASSASPAGLTASVPYGCYRDGAALVAAVTAAVLAQTGLVVTGAYNTTTGFASFTHGAGPTSFTVLPAASDHALMGMLGFLATNRVPASLLHCGDTQLSVRRDLGFHVCVRGAQAGIISNNDGAVVSDSVMFVPLALDPASTAAGTVVKPDGWGAEPAFLTLNQPLQGLQVFLRDSDGVELGASTVGRWVFEAAVALVHQ